MGRVSRYKKVKSCYNSSTFGEWGFGQDDTKKEKKRSRTAQRLKPNRKSLERNAAPEMEHDEFDMNTFHVKSKRVAVNGLSIATTKEAKQEEEPLWSSPNPSTRTVVGETAEDAKLFRQIGQDLEAKEKEKTRPSMGRMKGESKRSYQRRVKKETRVIIQQSKQSDLNPEKRQRKKEFLKQKKSKKRKVEVESNNNEGARQTDTREPHAEPVVFGDCVERPPVFSQLPRGAAARKRAPAATAKATSSMEALRDEVQKQYAILREKRREKYHF